jgi:hypothetical protein
MDRYGGPQTDLTIALHVGLYLANIIEIIEGPTLPLL